MVIEIKKGSTKEEIDAAVSQAAEHAAHAGKPFDAKKFAGGLKDFWMGTDPVAYQKNLRNEWEQDNS